MSNIYQGRLGLDRNSSFLDALTQPELGFVLTTGDILLSLTGTVGKRDYGNSVYLSNPTNLVLNQRVGCIKANNFCDSKYLLYVTKSLRFLNQFFFTSRGGTGNQANVGIADVNNIFIPFPIERERIKIAGILSKWDEGIEKTEKLIALKEKRKKALMQQLLTGKKRFPRFAPKGKMQDAKCENDYPSDWKEQSLGDLFGEVKDKVGDKNIPPYSISAGFGFKSQAEKWGKNIAGKQYGKYTHIKRGDFAYNKGNSKKFKCGCVYLLEEHEEISVPNVFISFRAKSALVSSNFYKHYFLADKLARPLKKIITSGARSDGLLNLNKKDFFAIKVPVPSTEEQNVTGAILDCADMEIKTLKSKHAELKEQKKGLMQQLLTGKTRVV